MNAAKIQLSSGHNESHGSGGEPIYHNIKTGWEISEEEQALVADAGWIITKNAIIAKVLVLFGELSGALQEQWKAAGWELDPAGKAVKETWRAGEGIGRAVKESGMAVEETGMPMKGIGMPMKEILETPPRISKGENYKGLPWVVLDYPRAFGRQDVFAVRTLFWWGNYFSVTLHLKGVYKDMFLPVIRDRVPMLAAAGFFIGVSDDEWRHELGQENYRPLGRTGTGGAVPGGIEEREGRSQAEPGGMEDQGAREVAGGMEDQGARAETGGMEDQGAPEVAGGMEDFPAEREFLKFSAKCDLKNWNEAGRHLMQLSDAVIRALGR